MTTDTTMVTAEMITASAKEWRAAGCEVDSTLGVFRMPYGFRTLLLQARLATGLTDWHALAWAVTESRRQVEERTRVTAQAREADAVSKLAAALSEDAAESLIGKMSERLQYAVRAQLRK